MQAVLDANAFIRAAISPAGAPARVIQRWRDRQFTLITADELISDVIDGCQRPKIKRLIRQSDAWIEGLVADLHRFADIVTPVNVRVVADDPDADDLLSMAVAGNADYFVTGERSLPQDRSVPDHPNCDASPVPDHHRAERNVTDRPTAISGCADGEDVIASPNTA